MANQVVGLSDQLFVGKATDGHEGFIALGDMAVEVGGGDKALVGGECSFLISHGKIRTHRAIPAFNE